MKDIRIYLLCLAAAIGLGGCAAVAAGGAGYVAGDEVEEDDGEFDPLEKTYDDNPNTGPF